MVGGTCQPSDKVHYNLGFFPNSTIIQAKSGKYEQSTGGWWSWLPEDAGLSVSCGSALSENVLYSARYESGDDHLGYSWEELDATVDDCDRYDPGCEFLVSNEELCSHQCEPWLTSDPAPYNDGCQVRRGARADQGTYVTCTVIFPGEHEMNTCAEDCDLSLAGWCWAQFTRGQWDPGWEE